MTQVQNLVPHLGIDEKVCRGAAESLVQLFSDEYTLQLKTWNLSYNIVGPRFAQMRSFLCENIDTLRALTDSTAVQIRSLGHRVPMVTEVIRLSKIEMPRGDFVDEDYVVQTLLKDHEHILQYLFREQEKLLTQVKEYVVQDYVLDVIKQHRKIAWALRSHLEIIPPSQQQWGQQGQQWPQQQGQQSWGQERPQFSQGWQQGQQSQQPFQQGMQGQQGQQPFQQGRPFEQPTKGQSLPFQQGQGQQSQPFQQGMQGQQSQPFQQGQQGREQQGLGLQGQQSQQPFQQKEQPFQQQFQQGQQSQQPFQQKPSEKGIGASVEVGKTGSSTSAPTSSGIGMNLGSQSSTPATSSSADPKSKEYPYAK